MPQAPGDLVLLAKVQRYSSVVRSEHATDAGDRVRRIADLFIGCGLLGVTGPLILLAVIALMRGPAPF